MLGTRTAEWMPAREIVGDPWPAKSMVSDAVLILVGNSEMGAHVRRNVGVI